MFDLAEQVQILPLVMDRDYAEIDRLFHEEQWPFVRGDLEASHAQPRAVALVARRGNDVLGFFAAHHFGDIGYLDMMVVDARARRSSVARKLYFETMRRMKQNGLQSFVAHSTNDSFRMFKYLRFQAGQSFTLLARDPCQEQEGQLSSQIKRLYDIAAITELDAQVFGLSRSVWIKALLAQSTTRFFGMHAGDSLSASVCLRARKGGAICLDAVNALDFSAAKVLLEEVIAAHANRRLECFARTGAPLHHHLLDCDFSVPDFFVPIGPLVEWRKGKVGSVGLSAAVQSLSWF